MIKVYTLLCFFLINGFFSYYQTAKWNDPLVFYTFLLNLVCVTAGFYRSVSQTRLNLDTIIWVFVYMFFVLAPLIQIQDGPFFPNSLPVQAPEVIRANLLIFTWNALFLLFRSRRRRKETDAGAEIRSEGLSFIGNGTRTIYFMLAALIFGVTLASFGMDYFYGFADYSARLPGKSMLLFVSIATQGIVFANWLFAYDRWRARKNVFIFVYLAVSSVIMLHQLSPFNTSRFYIGFCLILVFFLFYSRRFSPGKFIWILFSGMFLLFPFFNFLRFGLRQIQMPSLYHLMFDQLTELHFDAYSNLIATLQYTAINGLSFGYRLLGVLFFFVPRDVWPDKPLSSGELVGEFISGRYALNFTNLSNPLPSEFYINFGWSGVLAGAVFMAWLVNRLESGAADRALYTHALVAGFLFLIYRGDLMNAFAYCFGTYVIMVFIPALISRRRRRTVEAPIGGFANG